MKSALATTICALYEDNGLDVDTIAADQEVDKMLVISTLLNFSPKFRAEQAGADKEDQELVTKEELKEFVSDYKRIARYADDEGLRARCLQNLINLGAKVTDGLGANDPKKLLKQVGGAGNIYNLQMIINKAREAKAAVADRVADVLEAEVESSCQ